jgi:hypothetical protein
MQAYLVLVFALTGCFATAAQNSRTVLGVERSQSEVRIPPRETGLEIVRLFASRGFHLVDQRRSGAGLVLHFIGGRDVGERGPSSPGRVGSSFYVAIDPAPAQHAVVSIDGVPTINEVETCVPFSTRPCEADVGPGLDNYIDGHAEAWVVHGVFSELALHELVVGPGPRSPALVEQLTPYKICRAELHRAFLRVYQENDKETRARKIAALPPCA